ncbi:MAG: hypothetical protein ACOY4D_07510 [Pseudomonadota bacterium]
MNRQSFERASTAEAISGKTNTSVIGHNKKLFSATGKHGHSPPVNAIFAYPPPSPCATRNHQHEQQVQEYLSHRQRNIFHQPIESRRALRGRTRGNAQQRADDQADENFCAQIEHPAVTSRLIVTSVASI